MSLEQLETVMGDLRVQALRQGGEQLLDLVEARLGVAVRLTNYIRAGRL